MCDLRTIAPPLLTWYDEHRRCLPWRQDVSPYRTWVSEIMLQQTRVQTVLPYFERFMAAAPDVATLAALTEDELLGLWQGLGYYSRARNLRRAANQIMERHGGQLPDTYDELTALAGIGDYTAGAILSIACGQSVPAVDGNVLRIAARLTGDVGNVLDTAVRKRLRDKIAEALPETQAGDFNQALMDLGATVCLPKAPHCEECPLNAHCTARREHLQNALPVRQKKSKRRVEKRTVFLLTRDGALALRQRGDEGLLAGLWEFPHTAGALDEECAAAQLRAWHVTAHSWDGQWEDRHIFTHLTWEMTVYRLTVTGEGETDWVWCPPERRQSYPMPTAFAKLEKQKR